MALACFCSIFKLHLWANFIRAAAFPSVKPVSLATRSTEITSRVSDVYPFISRPLNATSIASASTDFALPNSSRHRRSSSSTAGAGDNGDATCVRWLACSEGVRDSCRVHLRVGVTGGCVLLCQWVNAVTRGRKVERSCVVSLIWSLERLFGPVRPCCLVRPMRRASSSWKRSLGGSRGVVFLAA